MFNVATFFKGVTKVLSDKVTLRAMKKEDLQAVLRDNIDSHSKIAYVLDLQDNNSWNKWAQNSLKLAMQKCNNPAKDVCNNYIRQLSGKAAGYERQRFLKSLAEGNKEFGEILEDISKKIDTLMEEEAIELHNVRMTQLALLGIIRQSDIVCNFSMYLYTFITRVSSHSTSLLPKYRENYLIDRQSQVSTIISNILDKKGAYQFLSETKSARSKQHDLVLGMLSGKAPSSQMLTGFSSTFLDQIWNALSYLNIFGAAMDAWDDYQLEKHKRNKETKEWLEQHVALLRMDLDEMDQTSPQYQKTLSIIRAYDEKIAEYDQKITAFETEE